MQRSETDQAALWANWPQDYASDSLRDLAEHGPHRSAKLLHGALQVQPQFACADVNCSMRRSSALPAHAATPGSSGQTEPSNIDRLGAACARQAQLGWCEPQGDEEAVSDPQTPQPLLCAPYDREPAR